MPRVPLFITEAQQQTFGELVIDLDVAGDAVRISKVAGHGIPEESWSIGYRQAVGSKRGHALAWILSERANIQSYLVEEESQASAHNCLTRLCRQEHKTEAGREVILPADLDAIEPQTCIERHAIVDFPFVLDERGIFVLLLDQHAAADKIDLLISRPIRAEDRHRLADVCPGKRSVAVVNARLL